VNATNTKWQALADAEIVKITNWMRQYMSKAVEYLLQIYKEFIQFDGQESINERHNNELTMLLSLQGN
jgi:hypothetical protein